MIAGGHAAFQMHFTGRTLRRNRSRRLFYTPDKRDPTTGDIHASLGYERRIAGQVVQGASVDWFAEALESPFEIVTPRPSANKKSTRKQSPSRDEAKAGTAARLPQGVPLLSGAWRWRITSSGYYGERRPGGILTFKEQADGRVAGHSYVEMPLQRGPAGVRSMISTAPFSGQSERLGDGRLRVAFSYSTSSAEKTVSEAYLLPDTRKIMGTSTVKLTRNDGSTTGFRYTWEALPFQRGNKGRH